ncbi:MAG: DMT family transporter [Gammaproteobacteria bacterium]|nr:DMT family transporter [Gammaproteobacteria bacterium]MDH3411795.1 DMT family transporter [Gammaproteobacteria bacterium]
MNGHVNKTMGATEWLLLVCLSILWGGSFFFVEVALEGFGPLTVVLGRVGLAAMTLWAIIALKGLAFPRSLKVWLALLCMGAINNMIPFSLIVWAQTEITGSLASILNATIPLFTVLVAHAFTRDEKLSTGKISGVATGFIGVVVIIGPDALSGIGANALAQIAVLCAAISYSFAGVFGRRFSGMSPLVVAAGQVTCSTLLMAPMALALEQPWSVTNPGFAAVGALVALAVFSTALAYVLYFRILATAGATNLLLVAFLIPGSAMLLGIPILGEVLDVEDFIGMLLIAAGLAAMDGRPAKFLRRII